MNPSIVDYLNSQGQASDYSSRAKLAQSKGIANYTGTAEQNTSLLNMLKTPTPTTPKPTTTTQSMGNQATAPYNTPPATSKPTLPSSQINNAVSSGALKEVTPTGTPVTNTQTFPQSSNPNVLTMNSAQAPKVDIKDFNQQMVAGNKNPTLTPTNPANTLDMNKLAGSTGLSAPIGSNTAVQGLVNQLLSKGNNTQDTTQNTTSQGGNSNTSTPSPYLNTSPSSQNTPPASTSTQNATSTAQPYNAYGGLISQLIQQTQMGSREKQLRDQQSQLQLDLADRVGAEASNPIPLEFQTGRISALQNLAAQRDKAISSQIANEQKQREIAGQALGAGVTAMTPVQVAPQNTYINPATGQVVANPNYQNLTNYAQAQQNIKIGQDAQSESARLNTTLNQLKTIEPTILNFMQQAGINPFDIQLMNSPMNSYKQFVDNPANATSFNAMMADVKTYTAQILGSSGLNPTEVSATINSFDPSSLSPVQLKAFLTNLDNLGQIRLKPLQETMNQAYGQNSSLGAYAGQQAQVNPNNAVLQNNNVVNPLTGEPMGVMGQLGAGTALQSSAGILQLIQALGGR